MVISIVLVVLIILDRKLLVIVLWIVFVIVSFGINSIMEFIIVLFKFVYRFNFINSIVNKVYRLLFNELIKNLFIFSFWYIVINILI